MGMFPSVWATRANDRRKADKAMIWSRDLKHLRCPGCGDKGTLRYVPEGQQARNPGDALLYRCETKDLNICRFEAYDDEPALVAAVERLRRDRVSPEIAE